MTPDTQVWISTPRAGISYHQIAPDSGVRKTNCGRYMGGLGATRGHVMPLAQVVELFGSKPCKACDGSSVPPVVVPGRKSWTS